MKLIKIQAINFRSVEDSGEFQIGDLTCLVGKNEAERPRYYMPSKVLPLLMVIMHTTRRGTTRADI